MTKVEILRVLLNERLLSAAEEIFGVFEKTIVEFQEEVSRTKEENSRLRSMLDVVIKPEIRLLRIDLEKPTVPVHEQPDPFEGQQHCKPEWSHSPGQVELEARWIKAEPREPESSLKDANHFQDSTQFSLHETDMGEYDEIYTLPSYSTQSGNYPLLSSSCQQSAFQMKTKYDLSDNEETEHTTESEPLSVKSRPTVSSAGRIENQEIVNGLGSRSNSDSKPLKSKRLQTGRIQRIDIRCKICGMYFSYVRSLVNHARMHAQNSECVCGVCGILSPESPEGTLDHLESHVGARICHVCGILFSGVKNLRDHMKIHPTEKSLHCSDCGKYFRKQYDLTNHMRVHTGERPYACQFCDKVFAQNGNLAVHMKSHSEKKHHCPVCGKHYSTRHYLTSHMKIHSGEKPHCCRFCGKRFLRKQDLLVHMRIHTGVKPYLCQCCGRAFTQSYNLKLHMKIHLRETKSMPS